MMYGSARRFAFALVLVGLAACSGGNGQRSASSIAVLPPQSAASAAATYNPILFPSEFTPVALNNSDTVAGDYAGAAALWRRGTIDTFGPSESYAVDINNAGTVVGYVYIGAAGGVIVYQPFVYAHGTFTELQGPELSNRITAINESGLMVGTSITVAKIRTVVIYPVNGAPLEPFASSTYAASDVVGVNDSGEYVGVYRLQGSEVEQPYVGRGSNIEPLPFIGYPVAINNSGVVTGYRTTNEGVQGFLWSARTGLTQLPTLPNMVFVQPSAINNRGDVVGEAYGTDEVPHAFLYSGGGVVDLGRTARPVAINDRGSILLQYLESAGGFKLERR